MKKPMVKSFLAAMAITAFLATPSLRAEILFQDATNYPYTNGCIEGQGQWYCYSPKTNPKLDALVTNNVLILNATNTDSVATPTNGWVNSTEFNYASFTINVGQLPSTVNGGYFCQLQDNADSNDCCHIFIDTRDTVVPGTYRLGIGNYATTFSSLMPPNNYPMDLATGITYTVVVLFDANQANETFVGSTLWINPSLQDYTNVLNGEEVSAGVGVGYAYGTDTTSNQKLLNINVSQIGFSPYANAGISNVLSGTTFEDVNQTNLPAFGIQPQSSTNYAGNSITLVAVASGVDLTYQWYSQTYGTLQDDGVNVIGSRSNILMVNNFQAADEYYAVVTDAYGYMATSATATNTVITVPTAPFFTEAPLNLTNNLFTSTGFTNAAEGTGPLYYQWYFAPTNTPNTFSPLPGQNSPALAFTLADYTYAGSYYVVVSNAIAGGSVATGPTNSLTEIAPVVASIQELHNLLVAIAPQITKSDTVYVNSNNVTVKGYVTSFGALCSATAAYSEFFIQEGNYGLYVFYSGAGVSNTVVPPVGSYVTISGPVEVYHGELEIEPSVSNPNAITIDPTVPVAVPAPQLGNGLFFNQVATNPLGATALLTDCTLFTFTNVYVYANRAGTPVSGTWYANGYSSYYLTQGQYSSSNTNTIELFVPAYARSALTNLWGQTVPASYFQVTGSFVSYSGTPEVEVTRIQDLVTNTPPAFAASATQTKGVPTLNWPAQAGSTYSVCSATNLSGPWVNQAFGLSYYPSFGAYTDTNHASVMFYRVSTP